MPTATSDCVYVSPARADESASAAIPPLTIE